MEVDTAQLTDTKSSKPNLQLSTARHGLSRPCCEVLLAAAGGGTCRFQRLQVQAGAQEDTKEGLNQAAEQVKGAAETARGSLNQLLGIRGASEESNIWKIRLQLTKPVTWVPLIWGELCSLGRTLALSMKNVAGCA